MRRIRVNSLSGIDGFPLRSVGQTVTAMIALPPDSELVPRLRARDGSAFREVVKRYHPAMVRVAGTYVPGRAVAEEVVQDTWVAVMRGLDGFEGRSSLKTWIFRILANQAKRRGERERRTVPLSSLAGELDQDDASVAPERFTGPPGRGVWAQPPERWSDQPESRLLADATLAIVASTAKLLPENQRRVLVLRDIEGWTSGEVCDVLELTEVNQRVLLHRARSRVRAALEAALGDVR
jgi:RNA polymerase sigma-70 factor (ECF subfamily)